MASPSANTSRAPSASPSTGSESPSRASGSRDSVSASASANAAFYRADTTFNPSPYQPPSRHPLYRPAALAVVPAVFDTPQATAPPFDGMFIHPPFNNLPEGVVLSAEGMNYAVMHQHPTWFLDIKDYITLDASPDNAIRYPRDLEPPRPRRQKDLLLRCTFCPRTYAGVNAKSMWTRHVREKHRVVLSKAWSDTATSSRRQSTGKSAVPGLPDTATPVKQASISTSTSGTKSPSITLPATKPVSAPVPKSKPGPKPGSKAAKPASPAKAKKVSAPRKIVIPAQRPKPPPPPPAVEPWVKSLSPPPVGILPPRMRPFRKSFAGTPGSTELKADNGPSTPANSSPESNQVQVAPEIGSVDPSANESISAANVSISAPAVLEGGPISSTEAAPMDAGEASTSSDPNAALSQSPSDEPITEILAERPADKGSEDGDSIQTDKEVADLLLMDVDMFVEEPDEDVDMELEDEEEGLHPPISLGGLAGPMFGVEEPRLDPFSLASRPMVVSSPVFSPALSPAVPQSTEGSSREQSVEQSVEDMRPGTPQSTEPPVEEETPPLGRFKVSSLAYLIDKNLSVSPPHSPPPPSNRSLTPPPTDMEDEPPTATLFAAMQDVFVLKMQKMNPVLKAKFLGHLQEQFGIQVKEDPPPLGASEDSVRWADLPESTVKQIMSEHAHANEEGDVAMAEDVLDNGFTALADEFKQDSAVQLKDELEDQLKTLVGAFTEELAVPLQDALTLQLKDEIIVQVADQMMEALIVQGEEAQVEFEWRRRFLERQLWAADEEIEVQEDVIQHPLHHLFLSKVMPADMDVRMPASLLC